MDEHWEFLEKYVTQQTRQGETNESNIIGINNCYLYYPYGMWPRFNRLRKTLYRECNSLIKTS